MITIVFCCVVNSFVLQLALLFSSLHFSSLLLSCRCRCVQRLRRRIFGETARRGENGVAQSANGAGGGRSGHRKMDRTPSFYTSRSIINLSGLSVSDPLPVSAETPTANSSNGSSPNKQKRRSSTGETAAIARMVANLKDDSVKQVSSPREENEIPAEASTNQSVSGDKEKAQHSDEFADFGMITLDDGDDLDKHSDDEADDKHSGITK